MCVAALPTREDAPLHVNQTMAQILIVAALSMAQPWDLGRFARTAIFFNSPQDVLQRLSPLKPPPNPCDGVLWSAAQSTRLQFGPLDDVVMGGVSESTFRVEDGRGVFSGLISTENNGGFAGCRTKALTPALQMSGAQGLLVRVRGDGQRYKFIVRDSYEWNGIAWAQSFDTTGDATWQDVELPFGGFVPTLFARRVPGAVLNTRQITTLQVTLSKFEYDNELNPSFSPGSFRLEVDSIGTY